jgi:hypothetical protein
MAQADLQAHPGRPSWLAAFGLLCADFRKVFEYVEPVDANLHVYSHRLYELYLRACTEFESVCRKALSAAGVAIAGAEPNVNDYRKLEPFLGMERFDASLSLIGRPPTGEPNQTSVWQQLSGIRTQTSRTSRRESGFSSSPRARIRSLKSKSREKNADCYLPTIELLMEER